MLCLKFPLLSTLIILLFIFNSFIVSLKFTQPLTSNFLPNIVSPFLILDIFIVESCTLFNIIFFSATFPTTSLTFIYTSFFASFKEILYSKSFGVDVISFSLYICLSFIYTLYGKDSITLNFIKYSSLSITSYTSFIGEIKFILDNLVFTVKATVS